MIEAMMMIGNGPRPGLSERSSAFSLVHSRGFPRYILDTREV